MRCLRIPNTSAFHGVTLIADAVALHAKLKQEAEKSAWKADGPNGEELEDSEGNVLDRATYRDLERQGLL